MTASETRAIADLLSYYKEVSDSLSAMLSSITEETTRLQIQSMIREVNEQFDRLRVFFAEFADEVLPSSFLASAQRARESIARQGTFVGRTSNVLEDIKTSALEAVERGLSSAQNNILSLLRQTQQELLSEQKLNQLIAEGFDVKGSPQGAAKILMEELIELADGEKYIEVNGRRYNVRDYVEMVARTKIMEANNKATIATAQEYGSDYVQASSHNTTCAVCAPNEGKVYSISGEDPRFPALNEEDQYPLHPNCQHSYTVIFLQTMERRGIDKYSDFSLGKSDVHPTNPNWIPLSERELK